MKTLAHLGLAALLTTTAFGQGAAARPTFTIADVHVSPRSTWVKRFENNVQGGWLNGDRYELRRATMLDLIKTAYGVDADKISGGPSWLDYDRFEVVAKAPPGTRAETLRLMLQSLLSDRFKLAVKPDTKPMPAYVLTASKDRAKLRPSDGSSTSGCTQRLVMGDAPSAVIECRSVTMDTFASDLRRLVGGRLNNLPIANQTGLEGSWDIDVQFNLIVNRINANGTATTDDGGVSVGEAVEKQLGLTLKLGTSPQPVLAVESVRQPSPNPPGVTEAFPPLPEPEFEVASVRLCTGKEGATIALRFEAGGRVTAQCEPIMSLVNQAWNLAIYEHPVGAPKALADSSTTATNITIVAKAPPGNFTGGQGGVDRDALNAMLRKLLIDRYQMKVHFENRPMDALTLAAGKPKLVKANPSNRTGCTRENQPNSMVKLMCQNITLTQFAEQMQSYDSTISYPVLDGTGIEGAWDFTLNYSFLVSLPKLSATQGGGITGQAAEPSGALSFREAIEKQLGLKVVTSKRPEPVFVIDHMEDKPAEN